MQPGAEINYLTSYLMHFPSSFYKQILYSVLIKMSFSSSYDSDSEGSLVDFIVKDEEDFEAYSGDEETSELDFPNPDVEIMNQYEDVKHNGTIMSGGVRKSTRTVKKPEIYIDSQYVNLMTNDIGSDCPFSEESGEDSQNTSEFSFNGDEDMESSDDEIV